VEKEFSVELEPQTFISNILKEGRKKSAAKEAEDSAISFVTMETFSGLSLD